MPAQSTTTRTHSKKSAMVGSAESRPRFFEALEDKNTMSLARLCATLGQSSSAQNLELLPEMAMNLVFACHAFLKNHERDLQTRFENAMARGATGNPGGLPTSILSPDDLAESLDRWLSDSERLRQRREREQRMQRSAVFKRHIRNGVMPFQNIPRIALKGIREEVGRKLWESFQCQTGFPGPSKVRTVDLERAAVLCVSLQDHASSHRAALTRENRVRGAALTREKKTQKEQRRKKSLALVRAADQKGFRL